MKRFWLCAIVVLVTLGFGWWPLRFTAPNDVAWLSEEGALRFNPHWGNRLTSNGGIAYASATIDLGDALEFSVLIETRGGQRRGGLGVILEFLDVEGDADHPLLKVAQWQDHLAVRSGRSREPERGRPYSEIGYRDCFAGEGYRHVLLSSDRDGATITCSGTQPKRFSGFRLIDPRIAGESLVVFGNDAGGGEPFSGALRRVAVYDRSYETLDAALAAAPSHEYSFVDSGVAATLGPESQSASPSVVVPDRLYPLSKRFFGLPDRKSFGKRAYWRDAAINVFGFMPLGACGFWALRERSRALAWRAFVSALALCAITSFSIELAQGFMVWRHSSLLDMALNGLGGAMGAFGALVASRRFSGAM